jgi:hypothetical protein
VKPPRRVQVGPHCYKVTLIPDGILEGAGSDGTCAPRHLSIGLDGSQPPSSLADTLCHELTHALLATVKLEDDVEESVCLALGPGLFALVRDNPEWVDWMRSL